MNPQSLIAAFRSSATSCSSSSSFISVRLISPPPSQQLVGQPLLRLDQPVDLLFDRAAADELVHQHVPLLADAEGAVGGLVLDGRVPPAVEVDDVRGRGQVQAGAAGLEREHEERQPSRPPGTCATSSRRRLHRRAAVQHQARAGRRPSPRNAASGSVISRNCVKTSTFSCRAAITSAISRSRANLPLSASAQAPSPSHCDGMIADLLEAASAIASTTPRRCDARRVCSSCVAPAPRTACS